MSAGSEHDPEPPSEPASELVSEPGSEAGSCSEAGTQNRNNGLQIANRTPDLRTSEPRFGPVAGGTGGPSSPAPPAGRLVGPMPAGGVNGAVLGATIARGRKGTGAMRRLRCPKCNGEMDRLGSELFEWKVRMEVVKGRLRVYRCRRCRKVFPRKGRDWVRCMRCRAARYEIPSPDPTGVHHWYTCSCIDTES